MNIELSIVKAFIKDRAVYFKYVSHIDRLNLPQEIRHLVNTVGKYYNNYPEHNYISMDELVAYFGLCYPTTKDKETYESIFKTLASLDTSDSLATEVVKALIEKHYVEQIVQTSLPVLSNETFDIIPKIEQAIGEYYEAVEISNKKESRMRSDIEHIRSLFEEEILGAGLKWRLDCLNGDIGSLRGSTLGHVFARPNTGKTSFLISEVTNFAGQLEADDCILYINNEDKGSRIEGRIWNAVCGATKYDIYEQLDKAKEIFESRGGNKIIFHDEPSMTMGEVNAMIKEHKPKIVVIDQGDKIQIRGGGSMANHDRLKAVYCGFRELAKTYDTNIITAGQASAEAQDKKWLQQTHMDNSKTGKPGELDYAIGIGVQGNDSDVRYLHVIRNKLKDGAMGRHMTLLNPMKARYTDA